MFSMAAIVICPPGLPIFPQERVGLYGRRFTVFKLLR
jgi:lipopolysaccharide/colanic/teichoic acid biosynthesis glycosyltransferase